MRNAGSLYQDDFIGEKASGRSIFPAECEGEKAMESNGEESMAVMNTHDVSSFKMDMLKRFLEQYFSVFIIGINLFVTTLIIFC